MEKPQSAKIILAGSTHTGEEEIILDVFQELKKDIAELKLIIAPRHPERNKEVFDLMQKRGLDCAKRSDDVDSCAPFSDAPACPLSSARR